jgi:hypothetical protein
MYVRCWNRFMKCTPVGLCVGEFAGSKPDRWHVPLVHRLRAVGQAVKALKRYIDMGRWKASGQRPILSFAPRGKFWPTGAKLSPRDEFFSQTHLVTLRPILNFSPRDKRWPPGANLFPKGWSYSLGVKFSVCPSILLNSRKCSPLLVNKGVNIPPRGQISPLGASGEVKNGPLFFNTGSSLGRDEHDRRGEHSPLRLPQEWTNSAL